MTRTIRLGVNIDHVATIRNARGSIYPEPVRAAQLAEIAGADGITVHLRGDRRHISEDDVAQLINTINIPLNLEMAATKEMVSIALRYRPHAVCIVPEHLEERTTEGGLDVASQEAYLKPLIKCMAEAGIHVSLFIEPEYKQLQAAVACGAPIVELHTGIYCRANGTERDLELNRLSSTASMAVILGLECHAGHGLNYNTVRSIAAIPHIVELNIGHFLIGEAIFCGLESAIQYMKVLINQACSNS